MAESSRESVAGENRTESQEVHLMTGVKSSRFSPLTLVKLDVSYDKTDINVGGTAEIFSSLNLWVEGFVVTGINF